MVRVLVFSVPACSFLLLCYHLHSVPLGLLGIPGVFCAAALAVAFGVSARRWAGEERREPRHLPLWIFTLGAALTAFYWIRVWAYQDWEMLGIPVLMAQVFGFWWPAVSYAMIVWFLEQKFIFASGRRRYWWRLAAGALAGIVGISIYSQASALYFQHFDRQPLRYEIQSLEYATPHALHLEPAQEIPPPPVPEGWPARETRLLVPRLEFRIEKAPLHWRKRSGHLFLEADLGDWKQVTSERSVRTEPFRQQIPNFVSRAKQLLRRKDLRQLTVRFRIGGGETLEFREPEQIGSRPE